MKVVNDILDVENEVFSHSIFSLCSLFQVSRDFIDGQDHDIIIHDDFAEVEWTLKKQLMAEDLTDLLERKYGFNIMFAVSKDNGKVVKVEAYSYPDEDCMAIIYISSTEHGLVDSMTIHFFDSVEVMYHHLRKDYQTISNEDCEVLEKQSLKNLIGNFI